MGVATFDEFGASSFFPALDGLRAVSILLVLFHHVRRDDADLLHTLHQNGRYGVSLFFVISGFLITTLFLREEKTAGRISLAKFYGRRAVRLLPLYYAVLALQCVAIFATNFYHADSVSLFSDKLPSYVFYFSNWLPTSSEGPFFFAWSLAVEEQFYLWFGIAMVFFPRRLLPALIVAAFGVKFLVYQAFGNVDVHSTIARVLFSYQEPLLLGVLLGFGLAKRRTYDLIAGLLGGRGIVPALGVAFIAMLSCWQFDSQSTWDGQLLNLVMTALAAAAVVRLRVPALGGRFLGHIGRVSYGIYLLHWFVLVVVHGILPAGTSPALLFLVSAVGVVIAASVSHRYFERPIIDYYKPKLSPPKQAQSPAPAAAPVTTVASPVMTNPA